MHILRPILAILIAVSVAVLPASVGIMPAAQASENAMIEKSQSASMPVECDHQRPAHSKAPKTADDCASMAGCAVSCFNYAGTTIPGVIPSLTVSRFQPIPVADVVILNRGSPPFRPPRI